MEKEENINKVIDKLKKEKNRLNESENDFSLDDDEISGINS